MSDSLKRALPLAVLALLALGAAIWLRDWLSFETLQRYRADLISWRDAWYWPTALAYVLVYAAAVAISLPGALFLTLAGGFAFGTWMGGALTVIGATLGATAIFAIVRLGFGAHLAQRLDASEGKIGRIKRGLDDNQWSMLFLMRLVPVVPFFVANLLPALLGVPARRFVISTFLGIIPGTFVYASVGAGLGTTFDVGGRPDLSVLLAPHVLGPILGLCLLAALPIIIKAFKGQEKAI